MTLATRIPIAGITLAVSLALPSGAAACSCIADPMSCRVDFGRDAALTRTATPVPAACASAAASFMVQGASRVSGTLWLASGEPASGVRVELVPADAVDAFGLVVALAGAVTTDAGGHFEFARVSPGRYLVGVEISGRHEGPLVFPATFHPGTPDRAVATIVTLDGTGSEELIPMLLPPPRPAFTLTGRAVHADGRPAAGASVVLARGNGDRGELTAPVEADDDGSFSLQVYEGLAYQVRAFYSADDDPGGARGESESFVVTHAPAPVTVVVRPGR